jgi:hypothetical protein
LLQKINNKLIKLINNNKQFNNYNVYENSINQDVNKLLDNQAKLFLDEDKVVLELFENCN